jgi:hypothetical protein
MKESRLQTATSSNTLPQRLAEFIDQVGGGCPLVTFIEGYGKHAVLWQYEKLDILIRCIGNEVESPRYWNPEELIELKAPSVASAFDVIRQTERLRQPTTDWPYLRFGPAIGTTLDPELLKHDA